MFLVDTIELLNKEELRTKEVTSEFPRTLPPLSFRHWAKDEISPAQTIPAQETKF